MNRDESEDNIYDVATKIRSLKDITSEDMTAAWVYLEYDGEEISILDLINLTSENEDPSRRRQIM